MPSPGAWLIVSFNLWVPAIVGARAARESKQQVLNLNWCIIILIITIYIHIYVYILCSVKMHAYFGGHESRQFLSVFSTNNVHIQVCVDQTWC